MGVMNPVLTPLDAQYMTFIEKLGPHGTKIKNWLFLADFVKIWLNFDNVNCVSYETYSGIIRCLIYAFNRKFGHVGKR